MSVERKTSNTTTPALARLSPGYFALVMATGIVALACARHDLVALARALLCFAAVAYGVLWALTLVRFVRHRGASIGDLGHHERVATFLSIPAATCVLGSGVAELTDWKGLAFWLWCLGVVLWIALGYAFFVVTTIREPKPSLESGIRGSWMLVIVATESIAVLGTEAASSRFTQALLVVSLLAHLLGAMLYVLFVTLILYRWMFFRMPPDKLKPDYWIDMGALAITTLAGAHLLRAASHWSLLADISPFLEGFTLFFWATGTWWIPLLLIVELWRHVFGRVPLVYSPDYWSFVFPLGMYSVATFMLARVAGLPFLDGVSVAFAVIALVAWIATFAGMLWHLSTALRIRRGAPVPRAA